MASDICQTQPTGLELNMDDEQKTPVCVKWDPPPPLAAPAAAAGAVTNYIITMTTTTDGNGGEPEARPSLNFMPWELALEYP